MRRARDLLADTVNRLVRTGRTTAARLVEKRIASNGAIGRIRNAQDNTGVDVLDRLADYLGVEPWQLLHPDPRVAELSQDAIEIGRQLDTIPDPELRRSIYASMVRLVELTREPRPLPDDAPDAVPGRHGRQVADVASGPAGRPPTR